MTNPGQLIQALKTVDHELFDQTWTSFLFNVEQATAVRQVDQATSKEILAAGMQWSGTGWTTSRAAMALYRLTKASVVSEDAKDYVYCWLLALALVWKVDVPQLTLPPHVSAASFALCELIEYKDPPSPMDADVDPDADEVAGCLAWEPAPVSLPPDLHYLFKKSETGQRLPLRDILVGVPHYSQLPERAPDNNRRQDGKSQADKTLKSNQQFVLQTLRLLAVTHGLLVAGAAEEAQQRFQQSWAAVCDLYFKLEEQRKERSLPGCVQRGDTLFTKEDLAAARLADQVNQAQAPQHGKFGGKSKGKGKYVPPPLLGLGTYSFRPSLRFQGRFRAAPFEYRGGGYNRGGYGSQFKPQGYGSHGRGRTKGLHTDIFLSPPSTFSMQAEIAMVAEERKPPHTGFGAEWRKPCCLPPCCPQSGAEAPPPPFYSWVWRSWRSTWKLGQ